MDSDPEKTGRLCQFHRSWCDYKQGFGDLSGEFWLGLDKINRLTRNTTNRLRVDLEYNLNSIIHRSHAEYDLFCVKSELENYALIIGGMPECKLFVSS